MSKKKTARNKKIFNLRKEGKTYGELAKKFKLVRSRIVAIVQNEAVDKVG